MKFDLYTTLMVATELARREGLDILATDLSRQMGELQMETVTENFEEFTKIFMDAIKFNLELLETRKMQEEKVEGYA
jgi:hypothetical protein